MVKKSDKRLLFSLTKKDFIVQHFKASGPGGQKRNKTSSAVRIIHPESGAKAEGKEARSQNQNKKNAFKRLLETKEFKSWHKKKVAELLYGESEVEKILKEWMMPENFKVDVWDSELKRYVQEVAGLHCRDVVKLSD